MDRFILELIFLSEKRKDILLFLKDGPKTTAEIKEYLNLSSVAVLPQLKKLKDNFLILKTEDAYSLSPLGIAIVIRMKAMVDLLNLFGMQYDYWAIHSLDCIPEPLLERIGELSKCSFSESLDRTRLFEPHREFVENIKISKKVSGISSIFHPSYPSLFLNFAKIGMGVSLLVTLPVYERLKEEFRAELCEFIKFENSSFYVCSEEIEFSYVVTDKFFSMSLPFFEGTFDYKQDVMSFDSVALQWGEDLFAYYRNISHKITEI